MKIQNVLVPVDFSPPSRLAVDHAVTLARKFHSRLTLMHVVESLSAFADSFRIETARVRKEHEEQATRMLSCLLGSEDQDDLDLRVVIRSGDIKDQICSAIHDENADIVVMGTHGRGLFGRLLIGSITEGILRKVAVPVLSVCRVAQTPAFERILFATDLSEGSSQGLAFALDLARTTHSDLVTVHAIDNASLAYAGGDIAQYVSEHSIEDANAKLAGFAAEAARQSVRNEVVVVDGNPAEVILKAADEQVPDVILLTLQKKGLVERALLGTTAERVIREANVPVLSVPVNAAPRH